MKFYLWMFLIILCCIFFQKLDKEAEDSYLDSQWADNSALKKSFHGIKDIKWGPR